MARLRRRAASPPSRQLPSPGSIRRERRALQQVREERLRDLGGLMLEMYRHDRFREDLLEERCRELAGIDSRLDELEAMLLAAQGRAPSVRCECGAPLPRSGHFCPNCGRPAGDAPVVACTVCGHSLPADAGFCAACGAAVEVKAQENGQEEAPVEAEDTPQ